MIQKVQALWKVLDGSLFKSVSARSVQKLRGNCINGALAELGMNEDDDEIAEPKCSEAPSDAAVPPSGKQAISQLTQFQLVLGWVVLIIVIGFAFWTARTYPDGEGMAPAPATAPLYC